MAFTVKNILDVIQGNEPYKPTDGNILLDIVTICAMRHANYLYGINPVVNNADSQSYRNKVIALSNMVSDRNVSALTNVMYQSIIIIGNIKNIAEFEDITTDQWATEITACMTETFEKVSKVTAIEKSSYSQENS